jgi:hypothetical protein
MAERDRHAACRATARGVEHVGRDAHA